MVIVYVLRNHIISYYTILVSTETREQRIDKDFFQRFRKWSNIIDGIFTTNNQRTSLGNTIFLAPTGAQGMLMCVCPSLRPAQSALEQSIFIFLGQRALREQAKSNQALREHSEGTQRALKIRVIPSEPKILRLVTSENPELKSNCNESRLMYKIFWFWGGEGNLS